MALPLVFLLLLGTAIATLLRVFLYRATILARWARSLWAIRVMLLFVSFVFYVTKLDASEDSFVLLLLNLCLFSVSDPSI